MASIRKKILVQVPAADVWDAVADFGALHRRLVAGFVIDAHMDGDTRVVTFANGNVARERLVDCDEIARRLVYTISSERIAHYNASVQVFEHSADKCRLVWIVDVLPNELRTYISDQMNQAANAMQLTLHANQPLAK